MFEKLKQFKDLRDKAKTLQSVLSEEKAEGSAAWGKVKVEVDGTQKVTRVSIDPSLLAPAEQSKLEAAVKEAANDAQHKVQSKAMAKMKSMGDLGIPGLG